MNRARLANGLSLGLLFLLAAGYFTQPISDIDFWWHLASGRFIAESGTVPSLDPFGVYDAGNYWAQTVLKGQWLGQVMLYAAYLAGGIDGVIVLRAAVLTGVVALVALRMRIARTAAVPALLVLFLIVMCLRGYLGERPQLFSFLLFASLVLLTEVAERRNEPRWLLAAPVIAGLWANFHGGVVLGCVFLTLHVGIPMLGDLLARRPVDGQRSRNGIAAVALAWLATLAAPNGLTTYEYLIRLEGNPLKGRVSEYMSPFALFDQVATTPSLPWYYATALVALVAIAAMVRRRALREAGVAAFLLVISATSYRYIPFFVIYALPLLAREAQRMPLPASASRWAPGVSLAGLALVAAASKGSLFHLGVAEQLYPVAAANHLHRTHASGRVFNSIAWGGYLTWRLGPSVIPFIDGRLLEPERATPYTHVLWLTEDGRRYFEQANFDFVLVPPANAFDRSATRYPLVAYLARHPDWQLVESDARSLLFHRRRTAAATPRPG